MNKKSPIARIKRLGLVMACLAIAGCAAPGSGGPAQSSGDGGRTVDDPMSASIMVASAWVEKSEGFFEPTHRTRLVASIDRKTRATMIAVEFELRYTSTSWRFVSNATHQSISGEPTDARNFTRQRSDVSSCSSGTCNYSESALFTVQEELLQALVVLKRPPWRIRFQCTRGAPLDTQFDVAQIDAFLARVKAARAAMK